MKKILILFLLYLQSANATTYYVKSSGGSGSGLDDINAWSYAKLNSSNLSPGDIILFNKGDTFFGRLNTFSGTSSSVITYGSYGVGNNPLITMLSTIMSWSKYSENIYYATIDVPELNVLVLDNQLQPMGRYPKTGYLTYESHSHNSSISSSKSLPFNPTGAEVVIRKYRQITDRHPITSYSGNVITYTSNGEHGTNFGNNNANEPNDGNGYFIQSSLNTLTALGDWYYDVINKRLYMHFGAGTPSTHVIKASTGTYNIKMDNGSYILFENLDFEGANSCAVNTNNVNYITFSKCNFLFQKNGINSGNGTRYLTIQSGSMSNLTNTAINISQEVSNITVDGMLFTNIGDIPGAGGSGGSQQLGIWIQGDSTTVRNCSLTKIGYHGIAQLGSNTVTENNFIDSYGLVKDDCGAIYDVWGGPGSVPSTNKIIRNNIIINGYGVLDGIADYSPHAEASGIYLDNSSNVQVTGNTIANGSFSGIFCVDVRLGNVISNNLIYNSKYQIHLYEASTELRNLTLTGNKFIAKTANQLTLYYHTYKNDDPSLFGTFNNNIYARPIDDNNTLQVFREYANGGITNYSVAEWKTAYSQDINSSKSAVSTTSLDNLRFDYNRKLTDVIIPIECFNLDVANNIYLSNITLHAYNSTVLVKVAAVKPLIVFYK